MHVLFLGPAGSPTERLLSEAGEQVIQKEGPISIGEVAPSGASFIVSHGYRHIVPAEVLDAFAGRAVNLHISYLPWNRGAHPNVWSFVDDTPKGVTIHHIGDELDAGDIIVQEEVEPHPDDTLATSHRRLEDRIVRLFRQHWPAIRRGTAPRHPQPAGGTYHRVADLATIEHLLTDGWDTPVSQLARR